MNTSKKILFISDCGNNKFLGYGHIFRCINIANFFKKRFDIFFLNKNKNVRNILKNYPFNLIKINKNKKIFFDYVFCDLPNSNYIKFNKLNYKKLIVVDEFNNFKKIKNAKIFKSLKIKNFLFLKFSNLLNTLNINKKLKKIDYLVSFGGSDYYNYSTKIFKILSKYKKIKFKFLKRLKGRNLVPKKDVINSKNQVFNAYNIKCYIGSGGNTMFEMLTHNIPCLIIPTSQYEKKYVSFLNKIAKVNFFDFKSNIFAQYQKTIEKSSFKINKKKILQEYKTIFK